MHAPGQGGVDAVVAVTGSKAADAAYAIAHRRGGRSEVENAEGGLALTKAVGTQGDALGDKGGDPGKEAAEPGEAGLEPGEKAEEDVPGMLRAREGDLAPGGGEFAGILEFVPEFGADDAGDDGEHDDIEGVEGDGVAPEVLVQDPGARDGGEPEKQPKCAEVQRADIQVRKHRFKYRIHCFRGVTTIVISSWEKAHAVVVPRYPFVMPAALPEFVAPETMDVLFSAQQIGERVAEIGQQISAEYVGESVVLIGVLKGAAIFLADLARSITVDNTFDFVAVSSYGRARVSSGAVKLIKDIDNPIEGKHVILVEDILDTGLTLSYLRQLMLAHKPASLKIATCLDKPERRLVPIEADYVGFSIPNRFVIGYGMDFAERYRGVGDIRIYPETPAGH